MTAARTSLHYQEKFGHSSCPSAEVELNISMDCEFGINHFSTDSCQLWGLADFCQMTAARAVNADSGSSSLMLLAFLDTQHVGAVTLVFATIEKCVIYTLISMVDFKTGECQKFTRQVSVNAIHKWTA